TRLSGRAMARSKAVGFFHTLRIKPPVPLPEVYHAAGRHIPEELHQPLHMRLYGVKVGGDPLPLDRGVASSYKNVPAFLGLIPELLVGVWMAGGESLLYAAQVVLIVADKARLVRPTCFLLALCLRLLVSLLTACLFLLEARRGRKPLFDGATQISPL